MRAELPRLETASAKSTLGEGESLVTAAKLICIVRGARGTGEVAPTLAVRGASKLSGRLGTLNSACFGCKRLRFRAPACRILDYSLIKNFQPRALSGTPLVRPKPM
mmetsp:Transcript_13542/g.35982  ORF Transcript_13542/g.35982 Transcript_13542/m.35982 type:complete len:106 (+) Transcript_13542:141-458(+)